MLDGIGQSINDGNFAFLDFVDVLGGFDVVVGIEGVLNKFAYHKSLGFVANSGQEKRLRMNCVAQFVAVCGLVWIIGILFWIALLNTT